MEREGAQVLARWERIARGDVAAHAGAVDDILERRRDGVTVVGAFTPAELAQVVERVGDTDDLRTRFPNGSVLGMPIGHVGPESTDLAEFFARNDLAGRRCVEAFGFDPHERVAALVGALDGRRRPAQPQWQGRPYVAGQLRWVDAGYDGLRSHADGEFGAEMRSGAMHHLDTTTEIIVHLSYFVVVQVPDTGGGLTVFDRTWELEDPENRPWEGGTRSGEFDEHEPRIEVPLDAGDLVLFGGGWRWHRVEPIGGIRPRITYGGFVGASRSGDELHFWC